MRRKGYKRGGFRTIREKANRKNRSIITGQEFKSRRSDQNPSKSFDFDGFFFIFDQNFALKIAPLFLLFRPFPLLTTAPPQTGKSRASGVCPEVRLLFALMRDTSPCPSGLFGGYFRFGLGNQLRQALLAGLLVMDADIAGPLHPVRPHRRVPPLPQMVIGLGDTSGAFVWPESLARETFWLIYGSSSSSPAVSSALNRRGEPM